jgi:hypothetical protein
MMMLKALTLAFNVCLFKTIKYKDYTMKNKLFFWIFSILVFLFFSTPERVYSGGGYINDDIQYNSFEINGIDSLYVTGDLTYYVEEDKRFRATIFFYTIFDKVLAKAYIKVTLKENDNNVSFDAPIYIEEGSDPLEVKGTHHIQWEIDTVEKIECCANHAGIIGCDDASRKIKCYDGVISTSCTCDEYDISD